MKLIAAAIGSVLSLLGAVVGLVLLVPPDHYPSDAHPGRGATDRDRKGPGTTARPAAKVTLAPRRPHAVEPLGHRKRAFRTPRTMTGRRSALVDQDAS